MESNTEARELNLSNNENGETRTEEGKLNHTEDDNIEISRPSLGSDADYDDELEVPESIHIVDMGDGPIAIENSEEEAEGKERHC